MLMGRLCFFSPCLSISVAMVLAVCSSFSQTEGSGVIPTTTGGSTTNFHFAEPNELTIVVNILGGVQRPGRYEISRSIDLLNLISLAGGTSEKGNLEKVTIVRTTKLTGKIERKETTVNLGTPAQLSESDLVLNHGDFIVVDVTSKLTVQEVLSYFTTAAVLTTAIVTVINQSKR
jgi:NADH:ubiquinone oxidoreductase subunit F (NADH-binding)